MRLFLLLFLVSSSIAGHSQSVFSKKKINSVVGKIDTLKRPEFHPIDSAKSKTDKGLNSINKFGEQATHLADTLNTMSKLEVFTKRIDSTEQALQKRLGVVQSKLSSRLDSLNALKLPTGNVEKQMKSLQARLDSLKNSKPIKDIQKAEARLNELQKNYTEKVSSIERKVSEKVEEAQQKVNSKINGLQTSYNEKVAGLEGAQTQINSKLSELSSGQIPGASNVDKLKLPIQQLPQFGSQIPGLSSASTPTVPSTQIPGLGNAQIPALATAQIPGASLPSLPGSQNVGTPPSLNSVTPNNASLPSVQSPNLSLPNSVPGMESINNIQSKLGEGKQLQGDVSKYSDEVKNLKNGDLEKTEELQTLAESQVETKELKKMREQTAAIEKYKEQSAKYRDPEAMKKELERQSKDIAFDKLADQKKEVDKAIADLNDQKTKFGSIKSINDLPKRRYNPMRDKTLRERLLPGVSIGIQTGTNFLVDINPYLGYRLTERWIVGLGWNERIASNFDKGRYFISDYRVYGSRFFAQFRVGSKLTLRAEVEQMNTFIKPSLLQPMDQPRRDWVWSYFVGIKQDFKISKKVNGNAQLLYNVYDPRRESPYSDRISLRFGFEFPYKKPKKSDND
jgi:hypothetical protein